jgi:arsenite methyltransferase
VCRLDQGNSTPASPDEIKNVIRKKYAGVSVSAIGKFEYPTGRGGARALGYNPAIIESAVPNLLESFCGVGNPFSLGDIRPGYVVLDIGCGAGFDLFTASRLVGENGRVCGIDLTDEMIERSQNNLADANVSNVEIKKVDSENIPYDDNTFDVVISNGVINLSPDKNITFSEIYRVLKPEGRLQFADVVLENELPANMAGSLEAWSQ